MKKGFTLIEILVVLSIVGLLSATSFISFAKLNENSIEQDYNKKVETFMDAAVVYLDGDENLRKIVYNDKGSVDIKLQNLYGKGLIEGNIINPLTKEEFNYESYVTIKYDGKLSKEFNIVEWGIIWKDLIKLQ